MNLIIIFLCLIMANACSILPKPQPLAAVHDFGVISSKQSGKNQSSNQQFPITVEAPKWLIDNRIHYRLLYINASQVRFYALDRWIAPPSELFEQLLNSSGMHWSAPAMIRLHFFEQQFISATQSKAVMDFTLNTVTANNNLKSIQQDFHLQFPCPTADAKGAVSGFTNLVKEAREKIANLLNETKL